MDYKVELQTTRVKIFDDYKRGPKLLLGQLWKGLYWVEKASINFNKVTNSLKPMKHLFVMAFKIILILVEVSSLFYGSHYDFALQCPIIDSIWF